MSMPNHLSTLTAAQADVITDLAIAAHVINTSAPGDVAASPALIGNDRAGDPTCRCPNQAAELAGRWGL